MHQYNCENDDGTLVYSLDRKTKPQIGQIITAYGGKWQVWYIEERMGKFRARLERVTP